MGEDFIAKLYCKISDHFLCILLTLRLSAKNLKLKKNSGYDHWNVWTNINKLYAQNSILKKIIPNTRF